MLKYHDIQRQFSKSEDIKIVPHDYCCNNIIMIIMKLLLTCFFYVTRLYSTQYLHIEFSLFTTQSFC